MVLEDIRPRQDLLELLLVMIWIDTNNINDMNDINDMNMIYKLKEENNKKKKYYDYASAQVRAYNDGA